MRLFLAINPPPDVRSSLWNATAPLRAAGPDIAWVSEPRVHLTLKFLGEHPDSAVAPLTGALEVVGRSHAAPVIRVATVDAFPNFRRPRVVWIGVDPEPRLELLHHDVEVACAALGYELDGRPFRPHVTLGRVKERGSPESMRALRSAAKKVRFTDEFLARSIDLMHSQPEAGGSKYTCLASASMRGA